MELRKHGAFLYGGLSSGSGGKRGGGRCGGRKARRPASRRPRCTAIVAAGMAAQRRGGADDAEAAEAAEALSGLWPREASGEEAAMRPDAAGRAARLGWGNLYTSYENSPHQAREGAQAP